jgi:hypothetical protein
MLKDDFFRQQSLPKFTGVLMLPVMLRAQPVLDCLWQGS